MSKRKRQPIKDPYTLRMRVYDKLGKPSEWINHGTGQFIGMETVQKQIRLLKANKPSQKVEIQFSYKGELRNFNGEVTGKSMVFDVRKR